MTTLSHQPAKVVHLIFDRYVNPSLKDAERQRRGSVPVAYQILGPDQQRSADFMKALSNPFFKESFVKFLVNYLESKEMAPFLEETRSLYITCGTQCFSFQNVDETITRKEETELECDHEEADTRIIFHLARMHQHENVLVRSSDTDVMVVLLSNMCKLPVNVKNVYLQLGNITSGSKRLLNVTALYNTLGNDLSRALTTFHMFTGSDHTPAFFRRGKIQPFKVLSSDSRFMKAFINLADNVVNHETFTVIEEFTCRMYGVRGCKTVNEARYELFCKAYKPKKSNEPVLKLARSFSSTNILSLIHI